MALFGFQGWQLAHTQLIRMLETIIELVEMGLDWMEPLSLQGRRDNSGTYWQPSCDHEGQRKEKTFIRGEGRKEPRSFTFECLDPQSSVILFQEIKGLQIELVW